MRSHLGYPAGPRFAGFEAWIGDAPYRTVEGTEEMVGDDCGAAIVYEDEGSFVESQGGRELDFRRVIVVYFFVCFLFDGCVDVEG